MPIIHQYKLEELIARLPELEPFDRQLTESRIRCVLIAAAGFEDRARAIVEKSQGYHWQDMCVIIYPTNTNDNQAGELAFGQMSCYKIENRVVYERQTFWESLQKYFNAYKNEGDSLCFVVDVSGMSSYVLYPVMEAVRRFVPRARLAVFYVEAAQYHPKKEDWDSFRSTIDDLNNSLMVAEQFQKTGSFESRGPNDVYTCPLYLGNNPAALATQFIAIPSFGLERMKEMIAYADEQFNVGRDDIRWIFGNPPDRENNGWRLNALIDLYRASIVSATTTVSTRNYTEILRLLEEIWEETRFQRHLVIATVGSKMQHLATYLFLCLHPSTALILSEPQEFKASQYSEGVGAAWWLSFGRIDELISALQRLGSLEFRWTSSLS